MHVHLDIVPAPARIRTRLGIGLALAAVYLIWGSTYLATRIGVASLPPPLMSGARCLLAGALLAAVVRRRGAAPLDRAAWGWAAVTGGLLFGGGMSGVALASQSVVSSIAAICAATIPLWTMLFAGLWGEWPQRTAWLGIALGLVGVILLQWDGDLRASPESAMLLVLAPISWSFGSALKRRLALWSFSSTRKLAPGVQRRIACTPVIPPCCISPYAWLAARPPSTPASRPGCSAPR